MGKDRISNKQEEAAKKEVTREPAAQKSKKRWQLDKSKLLCIDFICYYVMYIKVLGALMPLSLITTNNTDWRMKR